MNIKNRNYAMIQARLGSVRFPKKILAKIGKYRLIELLIIRLKKSKQIDQIFLLSPDNSKILKSIAKKHNVIFFLGDEHNVLKRFYDCAKKYNLKSNDNIIRITGDCPFLDCNIIDKGINVINNKKFDLVSNTHPSTYPDGLDFSIFKFYILKKTFKSANSFYDKEHVTSFMYNKKEFKKFNIKSKIDYSNLRLTVDIKKDLNFLNFIFSELKNPFFNFKELLNILKSNEIKKKYKFYYNSKNYRNIGSKMSLGYKLWVRANEIIPGGNMLLSKRPDNFLPNKWPTYFLKSKGCYVWGIDKKKYTDMCLMGVGTSLLGYSNKSVDSAVKKKIDQGILSTLNSVEDITLADYLVNLDPWSEMVRFARSGGEALAISIRIARAYTKKDLILFCGYHGWHDWYLSANLGDNKALNKHLISNLNVTGVPNILKNTSIPFKYNNLSFFKTLFNKNKKKIAGIIMEVERNEKLNINFLKLIRDVSKKNNIPLIFDECTTGFRETNSGIYKKYSIIPDMVMYGKSLSNGYAFSALLGKKDIMKSANESFISSTTWSEGIGPTAALATLKEMNKIKSWKLVKKKGKYIKKKWLLLAKKNNLKIKIYGIDAIPKFEIITKDFLHFKTFLTQEMLKKNILANNIIYVSVSHTKIIIDKYFFQLDKIFKIFAKCENGELKIKTLLNNEIAKDDFKKK